MDLPLMQEELGTLNLSKEEKEGLSEEIRELAREKDAVILAHNYQVPEVQDVADYLGDSLGLAREAAKTESERIVFCGVHFMAETASVLSPEKKVLIPFLTLVFSPQEPRRLSLLICFC